MNTKTYSRKWLWIQLNERRAARTGILLLLLLLLTLPATVQAQFDYTHNVDGTATITRYTGPGGDVIIPDTTNGLPVTSIGGYYDMYGEWNGAFAYCTGLTSVTIGDNVASIGNTAFYYCDLTSVTIPNSVSSIGYGAFSHTSLTNVAMGNSVTTIGDGAFAYCGGLLSITIPNSVTSIGIEAFVWADHLTSVTIGNSVSSIGDDAFLDCLSLMVFTVDAANAFYSSVDGVLLDKSQTTLIQCPSAKAGNVTIPGSVTNIGSYAFNNCVYLTNATIPNSVATIGDWAFGSCISLTNLTIGNSVTSIGSYAFYWCIGLTNFTIPNSVASIGYQAFGSCFSLTSVTIPNSVTSLGNYAFDDCNHLTSVMIGNRLTNIGSYAFCACHSLANVTIGKSVTGIGDGAFDACTSLTSVVIPSSVASIGNAAFMSCTSLTGVYFQGNAPTVALYEFTGDTNATVYYLPRTAGWGTTFGGRPTALWAQVPTIQTPPQTQTAEAGSSVGLWVDASSPLPLFYLWYLNHTNLLSCSTNCDLELTNVQFSQSGAYTVVVSNVLGATTSGPAMLNVIASVERRPVPGVKVTGQPASVMNVDFANSLTAAPSWTTLGSVSLTSTSQYYFDLTLPLPPQRYYRAWQTGTPGTMPSLSLPGMVPAITLTGNMGASLRLDYINQFGPTDAWFTLDTVRLTNMSQLYFDMSALGQPQRLYRLVQVP